MGFLQGLTGEPASDHFGERLTKNKNLDADVTLTTTRGGLQVAAGSRSVTPVAIVTDNGSAYWSATFARFIASRPELAHVRTRHRSPQTNGVIERFFQAIKYEDLYRHEIPDGLVLAERVTGYLTVYNTVRPHEAIGIATPLARYLQTPSTPPGANIHPSETVSDS